MSRQVLVKYLWRERNLRIVFPNVLGDVLELRLERCCLEDMDVLHSGVQRVGAAHMSLLDSR